MLFLPFVDGFLTVALVVLRGEMRVCERPAIQTSDAKKSGKPLPLFKYFYVRRTIAKPNGLSATKFWGLPMRRSQPLFELAIEFARLNLGANLKLDSKQGSLQSSSPY